MTDRELNITLREMARSEGLCDEWYGAWKDDDTIDECLDRYVRGFDFAVKNDWPSLKFVRKNFRDEDLLRHHIFLDKAGDYEADGSGYFVFLGESKATLTVSGFVAVTVYCRHHSEVDVKALEGARVFVTYYEDSRGDCRMDNWSRIKRYVRNNM